MKLFVLFSFEIAGIAMKNVCPYSNNRLFCLTVLLVLLQTLHRSLLEFLVACVLYFSSGMSLW